MTYPRLWLEEESDLPAIRLAFDDEDEDLDEDEWDEDDDWDDEDEDEDEDWDDEDEEDWDEWEDDDDDPDARLLAPLTLIRRVA